MSKSDPVAYTSKKLARYRLIVSKFLTFPLLNEIDQQLFR